MTTMSDLYANVREEYPHICHALSCGAKVRVIRVIAINIRIKTGSDVRVPFKAEPLID